ncbi:hypothetical protein K2173_001120 [Erythroxylum novogranatense]|uniref:E3 ubiquitin-protein ligase ARIH1-like UBA-like domain-containing protein n=1 Tax=Erythroxylum novogranatense TaxID=1862640 RepID=A0AAV8TIC9_9ROSI|nr:hypothetical protein K2173_001120 [Erythroxylum novogranatense]
MGQLSHPVRCIPISEGISHWVRREADICARQKEDVVKIATVFSISEVSAGILLRYYNWLYQHSC